MLGWNYASVVHIQTDCGTTTVFVGAAGAGLELRLCGAHTDRLWHHSCVSTYVLRVLGWNYASVVHTQTDYGTTTVFVGSAGAGLELRLCGAHTDRLRHHRLRRFRQEKKHGFSTFKIKDFLYTDNIHIQVKKKY